MSNQNIAFIHENFPFGGGEEVTINIAPYLKEAGYEIYIFSCCINKAVPGLTLIQLPDRKKIDTPLNIKFIREFLEEKNIKILILPSDYIKNISALRINKTIKILFILHSVPLWRAISRYNNLKTKKSLLNRLNWILINKLKYDILKMHLLLQKKRCKKIYNSVDAYFVLCAKYKVDVELILGVVGENKITVMPNSIRKANIKEEDILLKKKEILFVGRLSYVDKRIDRLLIVWKELYKQYPEWILRIIGRGPDEERLMQYVKENKIEQVVFEGFQDELSEYYRNASISCLTSTFEGWPLSLAESQSYGVIPVAFNCTAGVSDILSPSGENGVLVPPFDLKAYEQALKSLMDDHMLRQNMAKSVFEKAKSYTPQIISEKWIEVLNRLLTE